MTQPTIRLETSPLHSQHQSGVARYTYLLRKALQESNECQLTTTANPFPSLRIYAKLQSYGFAWPFDLSLPKVDLTIFPNFATWPTVKSKRTATVIHDLTYLYFPEIVEAKNLAHLKRVVPRSVKKADFIITVSEAVKAEILKEFNISAEKCIVTPIPPDETFFETASAESIQQVKEKYGLTPTKQYIYFIGNLEPRKNLTTLIQAYRLLPQHLKEQYGLVLAGGKGWKTEATQQALDEAIEAGEAIKHIGFIDQADSAALYQGAALFAMPSLYEGFGMPVLEAMASGIPVVAADIPVLREVGDTYATYADPRNPQAFADALAASLETPRPPREVLQENVRRYSWETNIQTILKCYTEA